MGLGPSQPTQEERQQLVGWLDRSGRLAAKALLEADVLLLCTGAGFSADSGLAVYKDIAELKAYRDLGLRYHDICRPEWAWKDPGLFYGFWGTCYNDYRDTEPHEGYEMLRRWRDERFSDTSIAKQIRGYLEAEAAAKALEGGKSQGGSSSSSSSSSCAHRFSKAPYPVLGTPGAFYVYTSNVDAHSFDYFEPWEVRECHGNVEIWQCGQETHPCSKETWRAPRDFRFEVDTVSMRAPEYQGQADNVAPEGAVAVKVEDDAKVEVEADGTAPRAGRVLRPFGRRKNPLQRLPQERGEPSGKSFRPMENRPLCPHCEGPARPAVLMFGDLSWVDDDPQEDRWSDWCKAVLMTARAVRHRGEPPLRVLILEIGCGGNVPTVRIATERVAARFQEESSVTVVRVNPDFPFPDRPFPQALPPLTHLAMPCRGLEALHKIEEYVDELQDVEIPRRSPPPEVPKTLKQEPRSRSRSRDTSRHRGSASAREAFPVNGREETAEEASRSAEEAVAADSATNGEAEETVCIHCSTPLPRPLGDGSANGTIEDVPLDETFLRGVWSRPASAGDTQDAAEAAAPPVQRGKAAGSKKGEELLVCTSCKLVLAKLVESNRHPRHTSLRGLSKAALEDAAAHCDFLLSKCVHRMFRNTERKPNSPLLDEFTATELSRFLDCDDEGPAVAEQSPSAEPHPSLTPAAAPLVVNASDAKMPRGRPGRKPAHARQLMETDDELLGAPEICAPVPPSRSLPPPAKTTRGKLPAVATAAVSEDEAEEETLVRNGRSRAQPQTSPPRADKLPKSLKRARPPSARDAAKLQDSAKALAAQASGAVSEGDAPMTGDEQPEVVPKRPPNRRKSMADPPNRRKSVAGGGARGKVAAAGEEPRPQPAKAPAKEPTPKLSSGDEGGHAQQADGKGSKKGRPKKGLNSREPNGSAAAAVGEAGTAAAPRQPPAAADASSSQKAKGEGGERVPAAVQAEISQLPKASYHDLQRLCGAFQLSIGGHRDLMVERITTHVKQLTQTQREEQFHVWVSKQMARGGVSQDTEKRIKRLLGV
eukprot:TRINITY_DN10085_c0_g1_i1.p1 TRINITY_DN10085_c0_g1~~TRINITY_DN10085_c0_g1_i1.p1  ORF type:complete len:1047 (-),score=243.13 TRINITY_DN10085_c0_g1_i1:72-3212(-)